VTLWPSRTPRYILCSASRSASQAILLHKFAEFCPVWSQNAHIKLAKTFATTTACSANVRTAFWKELKTLEDRRNTAKGGLHVCAKSWDVEICSVQIMSVLSVIDKTLSRWYIRQAMSSKQSCWQRDHHADNLGRNLSSKARKDVQIFTANDNVTVHLNVGYNKHYLGSKL
jgi:hypothetical protein